MTVHRLLEGNAPLLKGLCPSVCPSRFDLHSLATWRGEAVKRRDHDDETLAEIGRSYNVSGWTIARLASQRTTTL